MTHYPTGLADNFETLTIGRDLGEIGNQAVAKLADHGFVAATGITEYHAPSLVTMAREPHIEEFCPGDKIRYASVESLQRRLTGAKPSGMLAIYATLSQGPLSEQDLLAVDREDVEMVAYGWSGIRPASEAYGLKPSITTVYRVGRRGQELSKARGTKLGLPLGKLVIASAVEEYGADPADLELVTYGSNVAAERLYGALGFIAYDTTTVTRPTLHAEGSLINDNVVWQNSDGGLSVEDTRIRMRYDASRYPQGLTGEDR